MNLALSDIPLELKPGEDPDSSFVTLSKEQAEEVQECFEREKSYQKILSDSSSSPWSYFLVGAAAGLVIGALVTANH
jgi:ElaB/YqjD/DUF883 family membrane-anchored ribosome-binding protein